MTLFFEIPGSDKPQFARKLALRKAKLLKTLDSALSIDALKLKLLE